jgi:ATP-dependent DNA helicase PIF1
MRLLPDYQQWLDAANNPTAQSRHARDAVRNNPLIVAYYFVRRMHVFEQEVLRPKFNITNFWNRYKWQARGSTHNHGLY